ncbi:MAG TPA: Hsp20/alpha crystallin family protein [Candidatus Magasanikbacteria bacterium]|nr:Hsp20/alpha crystallin family protein [Candidatus Magasanikbacteria bacterium]
MAEKKVIKSIPIMEKTDFFSSLKNRVQAKTKKEEPEWELSQQDEGQLSVDVGQEENKLVIVATIAGAKPEDISVNIHNDLLTIRGKREREINLKEEDYFYRECYWGSFSRTIVLPVDVITDEAVATFKNGVLTIVIPKESSKKKVPIKVVE